jgi:hypothetical protein
VIAASPAANTEPSELISSSRPCQSVITPPAPLMTGARAAKSELQRIFDHQIDMAGRVFVGVAVAAPEELHFLRQRPCR